MWLLSFINEEVEKPYLHHQSTQNLHDLSILPRELRRIRLFWRFGSAKLLMFAQNAWWLFIHLKWRMWLCYEGVLDAILKIQKMDLYDIENVYPLYCQLLTKLSEHGSTEQMDYKGTKPSMSTSLYASSQEEVLRSASSQMRQGHLEKSEFGHSMDENIELSRNVPAMKQLLRLSTDEQILIVRDYMIAATAKDCSIMIALQSQGSDDKVSQTVTDDETGLHFSFRIGIVDSDRKPLSKLHEHFKLDRDILACQTWQALWSLQSRWILLGYQAILISLVPDVSM